MENDQKRFPQQNLLHRVVDEFDLNILDEKFLRRSFEKQRDVRSSMENDFREEICEDDRQRMFVHRDEIESKELLISIENNEEQLDSMEMYIPYSLYNQDELIVLFHLSIDLKKKRKRFFELLMKIKTLKKFH